MSAYDIGLRGQDATSANRIWCSTRLYEAGAGLWLPLVGVPQ
jgi:hypothetical protein